MTNFPPNGPADDEPDITGNPSTGDEPVADISPDDTTSSRLEDHESDRAAPADPAEEPTDELDQADRTEEPDPADPTAEPTEEPDQADPTEEPTEEPDPATSSPHGGGAGAGPAPGLGPYRRLYRSRSDRRVGGVAAGIAHYFGIDPTLVRIAFAILAITGVSVLVYLACWIIIPEHPHDRAEPVWQAPAGTDRTVALAVGAGSLGLAIALLSSSWILLAAVLIIAGVWLLSDQPSRRASPSASPSMPAPDTGDVDIDVMPGDLGVPVAAGSVSGPGWMPPPPVTGYVPGPAGLPAAEWEPAPPPARRPQRITRAVLSMLALLAATGIAAAAGDWWDVSATRFVGIGVLIIGVGVVLGALTDLGARWLIPLGLFGLLLLIPVSTVDTVIDDGVGEAVHRPTSIADLLDEYHHGAGELTVDLRGLDLSGVDRAIDIELGVGELIVLVPDDIGGTAFIEAGAGEISIDLTEVRFNRDLDGINIDTGRVRLPGDNGSLDLNVSVGFGVAEVRTR